MAQVLKREVRDRILDVAEKVFYKKGYRGTNLVEIVDKANSSVALVYTYFKNKEKLLDAIADTARFNFCLFFDEEGSSELRTASEIFDGIKKYRHELVNECKRFINDENWNLDWSDSKNEPKKSYT